MCLDFLINCPINILVNSLCWGPVKLQIEYVIPRPMGFSAQRLTLTTNCSIIKWMMALNWILDSGVFFFCLFVCFHSLIPLVLVLTLDKFASFNYSSVFHALIYPIYTIKHILLATQLRNLEGTGWVHVRSESGWTCTQHLLILLQWQHWSCFGFELWCLEYLTCSSSKVRACW